MKSKLIVMLLVLFICSPLSTVFADEIIDDPVEYTIDEEVIVDDGPVEYMMGDDEELDSEIPVE